MAGWVGGHGDKCGVVRRGDGFGDMGERLGDMGGGRGHGKRWERGRGNGNGMGRGTGERWEYEERKRWERGRGNGTVGKQREEMEQWRGKGEVRNRGRGEREMGGKAEEWKQASVVTGRKWGCGKWVGKRRKEREKGKGKRKGKRTGGAAAGPLSLSSAPSPPIGRAPPTCQNILVLLVEPIIHHPEKGGLKLRAVTLLVGSHCPSAPRGGPSFPALPHIGHYSSPPIGLKLREADQKH